MGQMSIGEPQDVMDAQKWDDLDPSRYGESKAEAKKTLVTSAEANYKIALEKELMKMNTLLSNVTDEELENKIVKVNIKKAEIEYVIG